MALSKGGYQGYGAVREYRDDPNLGEYRDNAGSFDDLFSQVTRNISTINTGGNKLSLNCDDALGKGHLTENKTVEKGHANTIETAARIIGTDRDNGQAGDRIHHISQETHKTVNETTKLFKQISRKSLDRSQRLKIDKVTHDFQESLQRFQSLQKKATEKARDAKREMQKPKPQKSAWMDDEDDEAMLVHDDTRRQQLMAQEQVIDDDLALIREREEQIRELEGDILDVNEIFRDLGAMVFEQGEQIDTIEANVEKAHTNVEEGTEQLSKAATYQRKSRKKLCCLVLIFVIIAAVIAIIVAVSVK